jgi:hypothetical protein
MSTSELPDLRFDSDVLGDTLAALRARLSLDVPERREMQRACASVVELLGQTSGVTLQQRWMTVERERWSDWEAGRGRLAPTRKWTWSPAALVLSRAIRPGWKLLSRARLSQWIAWLPPEDRCRSRCCGCVSGSPGSAGPTRRSAAAAICSG